MELVAWPDWLAIERVPVPDWLLESSPALPQGTGVLWAEIAGLILLMILVWLLGRKNIHQE